MTRRFLFLGLAVAVLALGGMTAQAGQVTLPSVLGSSDPTQGLTDLSGASNGNTTQVGNLEFSSFLYVPTNSQVPGQSVPPPASGVQVTEISPPITGVTGISFNGTFTAPEGAIYDYRISYLVTALSGTINGAYLSVVGGAGSNGGSGNVVVNETITTTGGAPLAALTVSGPGTNFVDTATFGTETTIRVTKDIMLTGGSDGGQFSVVDQGFTTSTNVIPEPTSMALLGIGLSGLFTFRRFLKRALAA